MLPSARQSSVQSWLRSLRAADAGGGGGAFITMGPGAGVELCLWSAGPRAVTSEAVPLSGWEPASLLPVRSSLVERVAQPM